MRRRSDLQEGINELLTRKVAIERKFRINACGYPKEVKISYELPKIFGEDRLNQIAFISDERYIRYALLCWAYRSYEKSNKL